MDELRPPVATWAAHRSSCTQDVSSTTAMSSAHEEATAASMVAEVSGPPTMQSDGGEWNDETDEDGSGDLLTKIKHGPICCPRHFSQQMHRPLQQRNANNVSH